MRNTPQRQSRYKIQVYKNPILAPSPSERPDMPIDTLKPMYKPPRIEDELVHIDAIEPDLNTDFEENAPQQDGIIYEVYERPGKEYLQESPELHTQVDGKNLVQRYVHD